MWNLSTNCLQLEFFLVQGDLKNKCVLHLIEPSQKKSWNWNIKKNCLDLRFNHLFVFICMQIFVLFIL